MNESETNKVLSDTENKDPIEPEAVHTESTKNTNFLLLYQPYFLWKCCSEFLNKNLTTQRQQFR
jgi:hypothetical protein